MGGWGRDSKERLCSIGNVERRELMRGQVNGSDIVRAIDMVPSFTVKEREYLE
jgi:hypothetical protein